MSFEHKVRRIIERTSVSGDGNSLGPFPTLGILEDTKPAADNIGVRALVGVSAPYIIYESNGDTYEAHADVQTLISATTFTQPYTGFLTINVTDGGKRSVDVFDGLTNAEKQSVITGAKDQDLSSKLSEMLSNSGIRLNCSHPGVYQIANPVVISNNNIEINCHTNAEFFLANMARCFMFKTTVSGLNNFKWRGGLVNGNDVNQGDQTSDGDAFDISKAMYLVKVNGLSVTDVVVKEIRGHGINHWNCNNFEFRNLIFDQAVDVIQPQGGKRRDGVTGMSSNGIIENISGYTNDDLVALACGVPWAGSGTVPQSIENVMVRNIRGQMKNGRSTWRGAALYTLDGYRADTISIDGVHGDFAEAHLFIGSYGVHTPGNLGKYTASNILGTAPANDTPGNRRAIRLYGVNADSITLSNVAISADDAHLAPDMLTIENCTIDTLNISSVSLIDTCTTNVAANVVNIRNNGVRVLNMNTVAVHSKNFPDSTLKRVVRRDQSGGSGTGVVNLYGSGWNVGRETTGFTKETVSVGGGSLVPFTESCVMSLDSVAAPATGAAMCDFNCGNVSYNGVGWVQTTIPVRDIAAGVPTTGAWKAGMVYLVTGAPKNSVLAYRNTSNVAPFNWFPIATGAVSSGANSALTDPITSYAGGVETLLEIGAGQATGFPDATVATGGGAGILRTYSSISSSSFSWQEYRVRMSNAVWSRYWDPQANAGVGGWSVFTKSYAT